MISVNRKLCCNNRFILSLIASIILSYSLISYTKHIHQFADGRIVVHSHLTQSSSTSSKSEHKHTELEFLILNLISTDLFNYFAILVFIGISLHILSFVKLKTDVIQFKRYFFNNLLRAPPNLHLVS